MYACDTPAGTEATSQEGHNHDIVETASKPLSPHTSAMGNIGNAHVHVNYSSPGKRGRMIWGGLVAYDRVWSAGAHNATSVSFSQDVFIAGQQVAKGTYAFFAVPGQERWILILNENYEQHLADDYDETRDVLRFTVQPETGVAPSESLTYTVIDSGGGRGAISMAWDSLRVSLPVSSIQ